MSQVPADYVLYIALNNCYYLGHCKPHYSDYDNDDGGGVPPLICLIIEVVMIKKL